MSQINVETKFNAAISLIGSDNSTAKEVLHVTDADTQHEELINLICNAANGFCNDHTRRQLRSAAHSEQHNGGRQFIWVDNFPIIAISRLATGRLDVMRINNSTDPATATVSVSSTALTLVLNGVSTSLLFTTYPTLSTLEAAVNGLGSNWSAEIINVSEYGGIASTELVPIFGRSCWGTQFAYVSTPNQYLDEFEVHPELGEIYRRAHFPVGYRNIFVDYTAGYDPAAIPPNLKDACLQMVLWLYKAYEEKRFGITSRTLGDGSITIETSDVPKSVIDILNGYKKRKTIV